MNTKQSHINLSKPAGTPAVIGINAPLSSLSELDDAAQLVLKEARRINAATVVTTLEQVFLHPGGVTTAKLRQLTGLERTILSPILTRLIRRGHIERVAYGVYRRAGSSLPSFSVVRGKDRAARVAPPKPGESIDLDDLSPRYSPASKSILEYLRDAGCPCSISEIVEATELPRNSVAVFLSRESGNGLFDRVGRGQYQWNPPVEEEKEAIEPPPLPRVLPFTLEVDEKRKARF